LNGYSTSSCSLAREEDPACGNTLLHRPSCASFIRIRGRGSGPGCAR
jgi:hypothetical protein